MQPKLLLPGLLILFTLSFWGCAVGTVDTIETGDVKTRQSRILIATQKSDFKQAVIREIRDSLEYNASYLKVIDVKKLPLESTTDYHAVIILNQCMAGRPDPRVESFIDDAREKDKIIVLTTGRLDSWKPESPRVDAITSASVMSRSTTIGQTLQGRHWRSSKPNEMLNVFNIFMNTAVSESGAVTVKTPLSKAGDYVELQARMDLIIAVTACSAGKCNNFKCTAIDVEVW